MGLNLETKIGKLTLKNPVLVASGTFGQAKEFEPFMDLKQLGGIVTKTITVKPRLGNPPPRIVETPSGMLNAIGLQNPGVDHFISDKLPYMRSLKIPIIVSAMGYSVEELVQVVTTLERAGGIDGYELNLSCPNVSYGARSKDRSSATKASASATEHGGSVGRTRRSFGGGDSSAGAAKMFAHDDKLIEQAVGAVRKVTKLTLLAKLGPDVSDIGRMAKAAENAGADGVSLINTFMAMVIDVKRRTPVLANKTGGLSGPCVRPIAVRMTWEAAKKIKIPVIGIGGICTANDALEFFIAGASAIQVGTANFRNPAASLTVLAGIRDFMQREKLSSMDALVGSLKI